MADSPRDQPPGSQDGDGGRRPSQRRQTQSILSSIGIVFFLAGCAVIAFALVVRYRPSTANPAEVTAAPVIGLTGMVSAGIMLVLVGVLSYIYGRRVSR